MKLSTIDYIHEFFKGEQRAGVQGETEEGTSVGDQVRWRTLLAREYHQVEIRANLLHAKKIINPLAER